MRAVMHDWPDKKCQEILSRTVEAMDKSYSRILIEDFVLPDQGVDMRAASLDITMMLFHMGIERTEAQWEELLHSVGLEIVKIYPKPGFESVIEAKIRD